MASTNPDTQECHTEKEIYIASNGIHLDIYFPVSALPNSFRETMDIPLGVSLISFGWGDKQFYLNTPTWDEFKLSVALKALFLKGDAALHITYHHFKNSSWIKLVICEHQYDLLLDYILKTFRRDERNHLIEIIDSGYSDNDRFYEAHGNLSPVNTCNQWVNKGLKRAEIKTSIWSPFDYGVLYHLPK